MTAVIQDLALGPEGRQRVDRGLVHGRTQGGRHSGHGLVHGVDLVGELVPGVVDEGGHVVPYLAEVVLQLGERVGIDGDLGEVRDGGADRVDVVADWSPRRCSRSRSRPRTRPGSSSRARRRRRRDGGHDGVGSWSRGCTGASDRASPCTGEVSVAAVSDSRWILRPVSARLDTVKTATRLALLDPESCYRAVKSRDRRFDGVFYTAVRTTGIYCRPSCPARTPALANVTFHPTAAAAQSAGYRACKRCLPDATPGSPDWDVAADVAGRAMRLDQRRPGRPRGGRGPGPAHRLHPPPPRPAAQPGARRPAPRAGPGPPGPDRPGAHRDERDVVDRRGVRGRVLQRPPVQRDRARGLRAEPHRAPRAACPLGHPRGRHDAPGRPHALRGSPAPRLPRPPPGAGRGGRRDPAGTPAPWTCPTARAPCASALADATVAGETAFVTATFALHDLRDTSAAVERVRRLLDADCDPVAVDDHFADDPVSAGWCGPRRACGCRVRWTGTRPPSAPSLGQQVSVTGARTVTGRIVAEHGRRIETDVPGLTHLFPDAGTLAQVDPETLPMPRARGRALVGAGHRPRRRGRSRSTAVPTVTTYAARSSSCPASVPGRPTTSRCGHSATPTSSCPPTSPCATS